MTREPLLCRRCLLEDMPQGAALAQTIRELIEQLPEEKRAEEALRQERLAACKQCTHLHRGTCALCGCYVELRSAKRLMGCPDLPGRWPSP